MLHRNIALTLALVASLFLVVSPATAWNSNKWRIQVSEGARSDGEIVFRFSPKGQAEFEIVVPIAKGTGENQVAKRIVEVFQNELDANIYKVEIDDGEDVLVKKSRGTPNFGLKVARNSVKAVRLKIDRE